MRQALHIILVAATIAMPALSAFADRVTVDPNLPSPPKAANAAPAEQLVGAADKRLSTTVTFDAPNVRLHAVCEKLAQLTGVAIMCGRSRNDWPVRDIPVTVCAKGIEAGKLLRCLAFSTHSILKAEKTENGTIAYRFVRDAALWNAVKVYEQDLRAVRAKENEWDWDVATRLADIPDAEIKTPPGENYWDYVIPAAKPLARVLAAFPADLKRKLMSGESFALTPGTAPESIRQVLFDFLRAKDSVYVTAARDFRAGRSESPVDELERDLSPTSDIEISNSTVVFRATGPGLPSVSIDTIIRVGGNSRSGLCSDLGCKSWNDSPSTLAHIASEYSSLKDTLPKKPEWPSQPEGPEGGAEFGRVVWTQESLNAKVALEAPKDDKKPHCMDALMALSNATGLTIVCEDFISRNDEYDISRAFGREQVAREALQASAPPIRWSACGDGKTVVGRDESWLRKHTNLMPQQAIDYLVTKANGPGVDFDDVVSLLAFSDDQISEWVTGSDLQAMDARFARPPDRAIWAFYRSLSPGNKSLAQSQAGLSLAAFDPRILLALFKEKARLDMSLFYAYSPDADPYQRLVDPDLIPSMVLKITTEEQLARFENGRRSTRFGGPGGSAAPPGFSKLHGYALVIECTKKDREFSITICGPNYLPYRSPSAADLTNTPKATMKPGKADS